MLLYKRIAKKHHKLTIYRNRMWTKLTVRTGKKTRFWKAQRVFDESWQVDITVFNKTRTSWQSMNSPAIKTNAYLLVRLWMSNIARLLQRLPGSRRGLRAHSESDRSTFSEWNLLRFFYEALEEVVKPWADAHFHGAPYEYHQSRLHRKMGRHGGKPISRIPGFLPNQDSGFKFKSSIW